MMRVYRWNSCRGRRGGGGSRRRYGRGGMGRMWISIRFIGQGRGYGEVEGWVEMMGLGLNFGVLIAESGRGKG